MLYYHFVILKGLLTSCTSSSAGAIVRWPTHVQSGTFCRTETVLVDVPMWTPHASGALWTPGLKY